ncbi:MAG: BON domain-containing protein [Proteobacteria bacterium]|nr:BON domain-containing protein [Pseudomonadota bacterium]
MMVKAALLHEPSLNSAEINDETFKGIVQLGDFVSSQANIVTAVKLARGTEGVISVQNDTNLECRIGRECTGAAASESLAAALPGRCAPDIKFRHRSEASTVRRSNSPLCRPDGQASPSARTMHAHDLRASFPIH